MREFENKEIGQIRFEFTDGTWFILDRSSFQHISFETKTKLDFATSEAYEQIEAKRIAAGENDSSNDLGINVNDSIKTKDRPM